MNLSPSPPPPSFAVFVNYWRQSADVCNSLAHKDGRRTDQESSVLAFRGIWLRYGVLTAATRVQHHWQHLQPEVQHHTCYTWTSLAFSALLASGHISHNLATSASACTHYRSRAKLTIVLRGASSSIVRRSTHAPSTRKPSSSAPRASSYRPPPPPSLV